MTQVFISYRHVSPDQDLAGFLEGYLKNRGKDEKLKNALRQILLGNGRPDEMGFQRLRAAGLIRGEDRHSAQIGCELYARYFKQH